MTLRFLTLALAFSLAFAPSPASADGPAKEDPAAALPSPHQGNPVAVQSDKDIPAVEDPMALISAGKHWLKEGNKELATAAFTAGLERDELNNYTKFAGTDYGAAVLAELMGDFEGSRKKWRELFQTDVLTAYHMISLKSEDPERDKLLADARAHIEGLVTKAKAGEQPVVYVTSKGKQRKLEVISNEEALEKAIAGEKMRYAYIEELDLSNKTFENPVVCSRCVVGSIKAYGSTFKEMLGFKGIVLGDVHLGKKWKGEVNKSGVIPAAQLETLFLRDSVLFGDLLMDGILIKDRGAVLPLMVVGGSADLRNLETQEGVLEMRYTVIDGELNLRGARVAGPAYFGYTRIGSANLARMLVESNILYFNSARFAGPVVIENSEFKRGATFENATFLKPAILRQSRTGDRLNFSRARMMEGVEFSQIELLHLDFLGTHIKGDSAFTDCVFKGNVRFSLDGLTRRLHLHDIDPLHNLYKLYQGDEDAEQDLTGKSQYGVRRVDDLTASFEGSTSFANSIFEKFVNFERVHFGVKNEADLANFYNTQFKGEAHFELCSFYADADFRTIFGNEMSFNQARFFRSFRLDDANIPGRLTLSGAELRGDATNSFYGARIASFGITFSQLIDEKGDHRLFYEKCVRAGDDNAAFLDDPRLFDARWNFEAEMEIEDPQVISDNAQKLCMQRLVSEFVILRASFNGRSMSTESRWAFWHLRHYKNKLGFHTGLKAGNYGSAFYYGFERVLFEKAFGWGVQLQNLFWSGLIVIIVFMILARLLCSDVTIDWDGKPTRYRELPPHAMFTISFHSFLGRARDWKSTNSNKTWKVLYTTEMIIGIVLITFFIGAYTSLVLR